MLSYHVPPLIEKDHFLGYLFSFILQMKWKQYHDSFSYFMKATAELYAEDKNLQQDHTHIQENEDDVQENAQ